MRISSIGRVGAVVTASALALSLGAGPVSAETTTAAASTAATAPSSFSASSVGIAADPVGPARFGSGVITSAGTTRFVGTGTFAGGGGATATISINGRARGAVAVLFSSTTPGAIAIDVPRSWGSGSVQANIAGYVSNTFYARKQVKTMRGDGYALKINRRNSKITFNARQIKVINPSSGKYVSVKRVKLQQLKKGNWKTLKTIKLNSKGNGSYSKKGNKKYRYRLYTPRTSSQERFVTIKTGKI